jgi:hypothetical protein
MCLRGNKANLAGAAGDRVGENLKVQAKVSTWYVSGQSREFAFY